MVGHVEPAGERRSVAPERVGTARRRVVPDVAFEVTPSMHRNLPYRPDFETRATVFTMKAGDGCFGPYLWPHWVRTGASYSISMAITWKSPAVRRWNKVLFVNALLRNWGMPQRPPGERPALDGLMPPPTRPPAHPWSRCAGASACVAGYARCCLGEGRTTTCSRASRAESWPALLPARVVETVWASKLHPFVAIHRTSKPTFVELRGE